MRIAVVFFGGGKRERVADLARGIAEYFESNAHHVDLIDGDRDTNTKLTVFEYLVVGTSATSFFSGQIDPKIGEFLARAGTVLGKRSFAFVLKSPFGAQKALKRLMNAMEREGIFLRYSEVLRSREEAALVARRLKIER